MTGPNLKAKSDDLRRSLPKNGHGTPPAMKGQLLGVIPHKEGEIRLAWDTYEGHSFLSVRLWTTDDGKAFWPSKVGFTVRLRDIATLGEAVGKALDLAITEAKRNPPRDWQSEGTDKF